MDDSQGDGTRGRAAEELILRTIAAHADSLLRTARRHSICVDDAHDAYQRSIEIFMGRAHRLDDARAAPWLHVVVKREAQAIRRARQKLLTSTEVDLDGRESEGLPTAEERLLSFDRVNRSAEALKRLKPQELRALWLRAQGHSYSEIGAITGWSYTKVNRCLTEGRRSFVERYEGIESGEECRSWLPVLSAMVDGEATAEQLVELRPHLRNCPGCRATLRALRESSKPLSAVLPVPLLVVDSGAGEHLSNLLLRVYEGVVGGLHERAIHSFTKAQSVVEATAAGKVTAVAASAAAVAGGGYASVERAVERPPQPRPVAKAQLRPAVQRDKPSVTAAGVRAAPVVPRAPRPARMKAPGSSRAFGPPAKSRRVGWAPEFRPQQRASSAQVRTSSFASREAGQAPMKRDSPVNGAASTAPEFSSAGSAPEFAP